MKNGVYSVQVDGNRRTICLGGQMTDKQLSGLSSHIEACLDGGAKIIIIDLSGLESLDASTLDFLADQTDRMRSFGTEIQIKSPKAEITAMLDLSGSGRFLNIVKKEKSWLDREEDREALDGLMEFDHGDQ